MNRVKPLDFFNDRITNYNRVFPETAYKLLGIMNYRNTDGKDIFRFVTEQPFIEGVTPNRDDINKKMMEMGFKIGRLSSQYYLELEDGKFLKVTDVRMKNCLKDKDGNVFVIDPVIRLSDEIDNIKKSN